MITSILIRGKQANPAKKRGNLMTKADWNLCPLKRKDKPRKTGSHQKVKKATNKQTKPTTTTMRFSPQSLWKEPIP